MIVTTGFTEKRHSYEDLQLDCVPGIIEIVEKRPIKAIFGDNIQYLRWIYDNMKKGYFHVGIVDPPYGINIGSRMLGAKNMEAHKNRGYETGSWDNEVPSDEYWFLMKYACRNLIVWGGNYFSNHIPPGRCCLAWDKLNNGMSFADFELALTTFDKNARVIRKSRNSKTDDDGEKRHPTQKPVYLYDYLHLNFVEKGQRVLDTHGGSFSHAVAAIKNNVDLTIIEREDSYFRSGLQALILPNSKQRLF